MRYQVKESSAEGFNTIVLKDAVTDSEVIVVPDIGANAVYCRLYGNDLIEGAPDLSTLAEHSAEFGTPLLWPPNRIRNGIFQFQGREYRLPVNEGSNHLHGELRHLPWEVIDAGTDEAQGAAVTLEFRTNQSTRVSAYYPHAIVFRLTYRLRDGWLSGHMEAVNDGTDEAPFGFGLHPYFSFQGDSKDVRLTAPVAMEYIKQEDGFIMEMPERNALCSQLNKGFPLSELPSDVDHFLFRLSDSKHACVIERGQEGIKIMLEFSETFPFLVLFKPKWADAISLEPWSSITDAFNVPLPTEWTGASSLKPGERREYSWQWGLETK